MKASVFAPESAAFHWLALPALRAGQLSVELVMCTLKPVSWSDSFGLFNVLGCFFKGDLCPGTTMCKIHHYIDPQPLDQRTPRHHKTSALRTKAPYFDPARTASIGIGAPCLGHWLRHMEFCDPHA